MPISLSTRCQARVGFHVANTGFSLRLTVSRQAGVRNRGASRRGKDAPSVLALGEAQGKAVHAFVVSAASSASRSPAPPYQLQLRPLFCTCSHVISGLK